MSSKRGTFPSVPRSQSPTGLNGTNQSAWKCLGPQLSWVCQSLSKGGRSLDSVLGCALGSLYVSLALAVSFRFCLSRHFLQKAFFGCSKELMASSLTPTTLGTVYIGAFGEIAYLICSVPGTCCETAICEAGTPGVFIEL